MTKPVTVAQIEKQKQNGEKIVMLTAYDYPSALLADQAGVDLLLVGDSLANVVLGLPSTTPVTMADMILHTKPVARAATHALVVADMPFGSYQTGTEDALRNAVALIKEGGAAAVKLEGGAEVAPLVREMTGRGLPVMAHIGLLPQTAASQEGYRIQGRTAKGAERLLQAALALEEAGAFACVLECVAAEAAARISQKLTRMATIGIGAGAGCDGQVLVLHDMLGLNQGHVPRFVKQYANLAEPFRAAISSYAAEVRAGSFPSPDHAFAMDEEEVGKLY